MAYAITVTMQANKKNRAYKWGIALFFLGLALATTALTHFLSQRLTRLNSDRDIYPFYHCEQVLSGSELIVSRDDEQYSVILAYVEASPEPGTVPYRRFCEEHRLSPEKTKRWHRVAKNTLHSWVFKQNIQLSTAPQAAVDKNSSQARMNGVDIAKKLLQGGFVVVKKSAKNPPPNYLDWQQEAIDAKKGLWK